MQKLLNSLAMNPNSSNHMLPITRNELISNNETGRFFPGSQISRQQRVVKQELLASNHHEVKEEEEEEENDFYDEDEHDESLEVDVDMMDEAEIDDELEDHHKSLIESSNSHSELFNNTTANSSGSSSTMAPAPNFVRQTTRKGAGQNFKRQESLGDEKQEAKFCGSSTPRSSTSSVAIPTLKGNKNSGNAKAKGTSWLDTQPKLNSKSKSGYILFSAEVRKRVMNENPSAGFGEVSRMVGIEWKRLSNEQKRQYETRAQFIAEERAKAELLTPTSKMPQPGQIRVYCCRWQQCDYQFDSQDGLYAHIRISHTSQLLENDNQYACLWNSCIKYRKDGKPFPTLPRLHRHIKEKHMPTTIRLMFPNQRAKNYFVHSPPAKPHLSNGGTHHTSKSMQTEDYGRFVHHPYGDVPNNPVSCPVPTPIFPGSNNQLLSGPSTSEQQQQGLRNHMTIGQPQQQISQPQQQPMVAPSSTPIRYMSSAQPTMTTPKSSYGGGQSSLLNGTLISQQQSSTSNNSTHYVIQQRQVPQQQQQIHQQQSGIQQQTVFIPAGQQAIVVNGTTVYIPANAQTIILPPGYTGPQQHQQIVVHTTQPPQQQQQMVQPHLHSKQQQQTQQYQQSYNSTTIAAAASTPGHSQNLSVSAHSQQQHHSHEVFAQSSSAAIGVAQRHHQVNGMPTTQSASTSHAQSASINVASSSSSVPVNSSTALGALLHQNSHPQHASSLSQQQQQPSTSAAIYQSTSQIEQQQSQIGPDVQQITDPGRTIVNAPKLTEPIFLSPSNAINVKRVVHSEAYLKYIESMFNAGAKQRIVSKWDKSLLASHRNTVVPNHRKLPYDWIRRSANGSKPKEEGIVRALWKLRDQLVEGTTAINRNTLGNPVEAEAPHP